MEYKFNLVNPKIKLLKSLLNKYGNLKISTIIKRQELKDDKLIKVYIVTILDVAFVHDTTRYDFIAFQSKKEAIKYMKVNDCSSRPLTMSKGFFKRSSRFVL